MSVAARCSDVAVCVDFGSTFTKASLVDLGAGRVAAAAEHPTTVGTDVLDGYATCLAALVRADPRASDAEVRACSSAGGGLRIAVVGAEELVTAEAGRRVALSSGGRVVAVMAAAGETGRVPQDALERALRHTTSQADPDLVLLTGGTDGGNPEVLLTAAAALVASGWRGPVVVAGNEAAAPQVARLLADVPHTVTGNVLPRIGALEPGPARAAVREMFLRHVIGGKHLSAHADFTAMVRGATPDVVLTGVELLARGLGPDQPGAGDVVVVDVGGATTDVHSVVETDPEDAGLAREVVATTPVSRTVEGDLGMRWSAPSTVEAAGLQQYADAARARAADPGLVPASPAELEADEAIARAAATLALRRHAGRARVVVDAAGRLVERTGKDLRRVTLLVGSGGVLRHGGPGSTARVLGGCIGRDPEGWQLPERARLVVDRDYVLAAAGLLAEQQPAAAYRLARSLLDTAPVGGAADSLTR